MHRYAASLVVCAFCCGSAAAQVVSVQRPPLPDYREATYLGETNCAPDPYHANCNHRGDKYYTILIDGKPYLLRPGFSDAGLLSMVYALLAPQNHALLLLPGKNVLAHLAPDIGIQVHLGGRGVDVRVLAQSSKGPRYMASHYSLAAPRTAAD
ncbi:MAG: hypothetical protein WBX06_15120 [Acidobacteriaceae bacterium]